jgi:hypothetical protein
MDGKGRIGQFILAQGQEGRMKSSILTTGPYMDMLFDAMFVPQKQEDGSFLWTNPASKCDQLSDGYSFNIRPANETEDGKIPLTALDDVGHYSLWLFDNIEESAGLDLVVGTEEVSFSEIAKTFSSVTGTTGIHVYVPLEQYLPAAEPYPGAPANWALGPDAPRDESVQTWRANFSAWWRYWGEGHAIRRDFVMLDKIHPQRIKSLAEWMKKVGYEGEPKRVLKGMEDRADNMKV